MEKPGMEHGGNRQESRLNPQLPMKSQKGDSTFAYAIPPAINRVAKAA